MPYVLISEQNSLIQSCMSCYTEKKDKPEQYIVGAKKASAAICNTAAQSAETALTRLNPKSDRPAHLTIKVNV